ncbi:MAG: hypothetical protein NTZ83_01040 [Candidatus Pacearchaeota archaeon]|nr:hypothetical protein [Candidatus Pacearchaeota archaeon]
MNNENKSYFLEKETNTIVINRELTKLDLFVKDFLDILKKHANYLIVSGFVSISTGRTRGTEDVDCLVSKLDKVNFAILLEDLFKNNFWCYQGDTLEELWKYIENKDSIRFAKKEEMFPNIEFITVDESKPAKYFELTHPQEIKIQNFEFKIPPIEFEILYKEIVLAGEKDIADAKHLRTFFSEIIRKEKFKEYEPIIKKELR